MSQTPSVDDEEQPAASANREAAYETGRLMAFSDGVFAIAITLLVLNVPVPNIAEADAMSRLPRALLGDAPRLLTFALSFFLVGFYWIRHHQLFRQLTDVSVWLLWVNLVVLFLVCLLPFSSGVVGRYPNTVVAAELYAVNLAAIALSFTALNVYAIRGGLIRLPPGTVPVLFGRRFLWPLAVVGLVMVLSPINLTASYAIGATLMAAVGVYAAVPRVTRSAPLAGAGAGQLRFSRVAPPVTLHGHSSPADLFRALLVGPEPAITVTGNTVDFEYRRLRRFPAGRGQSADIALNTSIPWRLEVNGGLTGLTADLQNLQITGVHISGGASRIELRLPRPTGAVRIQIDGGAAYVSIRRPEGVAIRTTAPDGAAEIRFDDQRVGPLESQRPVQSPDYDGKSDRYDIELLGGVARLTISQG